jgi:hypothetical protein
MKDINKYILEKFNTDSIEEYLESIVNSAKGKPDVYDDTESWEARDAFDYWESSFGELDDVNEFISEYCDRKCVAGWSTDKSFEETEKIIPQLLKDIMKKSKPKMPYKKRNNQMEVWEAKQDGFDITVLKFGYYANDNGTDYKEYWYMIAIEES